MKRLACCSAALLFTLSLATHAQTVGDSSATPRPASSSAMGWLTMGHYSPYIEIGSALALPDHKRCTAEFPTIGVARVQLGYRELRPFKSWGFKMDERGA